MDSKLELFLNKINLPKEEYNYFNEGKILKIKSTKDKLNWDFIIETKELLPIKVLEYLDENIKKGFPNLNTVTYEIVPKTVNKSLINSYFNYIINKLSLGKAVSMIFYGKEIKATTNGMVITASNKAEENMINSRLNEIINTYHKIGFESLNLKIELLDGGNELKEEIKKELEEEVKEASKEATEFLNKPKERPRERMQMVSTKKDPESSAIIGFENMSDPVSVQTITGEMNDVTIEGYIFGKELFESTKSVFKIITLKVSDLSDSILVKIFFRNEEDFNRVNGELNENSWYKINGRVSFDTFANDYVLSARNIVPIESKFKEEKDTEEEKRVELHAHTIMSQMDGVVSVEDLIKQAKNGDIEE